MGGYEAGRVRVVFDGVHEEYVCKMKKKPKCIRDLHNPFDPCGK